MQKSGKLELSFVNVSMLKNDMVLCEPNGL